MEPENHLFQILKNDNKNRERKKICERLAIRYLGKFHHFFTELRLVGSIEAVQS